MKKSKRQLSVTMKKTVLFVIVALLSVTLKAQDTPLSALYDKFIGETGFETTEILPASMNFEWESAGENSTIREMMKDIEKIRISRYENDKGNGSQEKLWKKMQKAAGNELYTEVVTVNADKVQARILMLKGEPGITREIALMEKDDEGMLLMTMTGNMNFSQMFSPENMESLREMGDYFMQMKGSCPHNK